MKKFWLFVFIVGVLVWLVGGRREKVRADTCVVGPGVWCAAQTCGVWYQPPDNCLTTSDQCWYYDPADLKEDEYVGSGGGGPDGNYFPACGDTINCTWNDTYGCEPTGTNTSCLWCYNAQSSCTCTDAYGTPEACCYPCSDGSGCDGTTGGGGGGSGSCTPSVPDKPSLSSPSNGDSVAADGSSATVTLSWEAPNDWNSCNDTNLYDVYLEQDDTPGDGLLTDSSTLVSNCSGITATSCSVDLAVGHKYEWTVAARNEIASNTASPWWFDLNGALAGTVYLDVDNTCNTTQPSGFGGGLTASLRNTSYSDGVDSNGEFAISAPGGSYTLDMTVPSGYVCSTGPLGTGCGGGCPTQTGVSSPSSNNNFFFTQKRSAWWQVAGGNIYAGAANGGTVIRSLIPGTVPAAERYLIVGDEGVVLHRSGNLALDNGSVSAAGYKAESAYKGKKMDFDFWKAHVGVDLEPQNDWAVDSMEKPSYNPNKKYYWLTPTSGTASLAADWVVNSGEKYIVFINGDLQIDHNITVANGGFLAMIVKGNITVEPNVTQVEGIYITDGKFITQASTSGYDSQLQVEGTVVAWTDVELHRDLGAANTTKPAEKFSYRLDLIENMPEVMKGFLRPDRFRETCQVFGPFVGVLPSSDYIV